MQIKEKNNLNDENSSPWYRSERQMMDVLAQRFSKFGFLKFNHNLSLEQNIVYSEFSY